MSSKFVYEKGDIRICDTVCDGCIFEINADECQKHGEKPDVIKQNKSACAFYRNENFIDLD